MATGGGLPAPLWWLLLFLSLPSLSTECARVFYDVGQSQPAHSSSPTGGRDATLSAQGALQDVQNGDVKQAFTDDANPHVPAAFSDTRTGSTGDGSTVKKALSNDATPHVPSAFTDSTKGNGSNGGPPVKKAFTDEGSPNVPSAFTDSGGPGIKKAFIDSGDVVPMVEKKPAPNGGKDAGMHLPPALSADDSSGGPEGPSSLLSGGDGSDLQVPSALTGEERSGSPVELCDSPLCQIAEGEAGGDRGSDPRVPSALTGAADSGSPVELCDSHLCQMAEDGEKPSDISDATVSGSPVQLGNSPLFAKMESGSVSQASSRAPLIKPAFADDGNDPNKKHAFSASISGAGGVGTISMDTSDKGAGGTGTISTESSAGAGGTSGISFSDGSIAYSMGAVSGGGNADSGALASGAGSGGGGEHVASTDDYDPDKSNWEKRDEYLIVKHDKYMEGQDATEYKREENEETGGNYGPPPKQAPPSPPVPAPKEAPPSPPAPLKQVPPPPPPMQ
mmetsp:Transcript_16208/g.45174  ORF Transcript_16208/g.45174 Transcript_16208/m.45174 type:complete len:505 (+) Transcript_16208:646-2160(+)|eukprot:CAMPEP_0117661140 /NCGR_PEP_ID=MMETSP0804-20121206/7382_1 /TAXON_ID=1074897 /ORGANISM="Tetraselmis astigmatica, Strain CCMP880" /LENGTH=504 /DNA_ID=CAMNT_0005467995 /DNA_START=764 /DNA_END=2278 /DNA_ORIENTATION=-